MVRLHSVGFSWVAVIFSVHPTGPSNTTLSQSQIGLWLVPGTAQEPKEETWQRLLKWMMAAQGCHGPTVLASKIWSHLISIDQHHDRTVDLAREVASVSRLSAVMFLASWEETLPNGELDPVIPGPLRVLRVPSVMSGDKGYSRKQNLNICCGTRIRYLQPPPLLLNMVILIA